MKMKLQLQFCFMYKSLKRVVKTYVWSLPEHSLQRFLTGIKTRKRKREKKKRKEKNFFFTYLYARLTQLFFLYMETADRLTPLMVSLTSSPLRWRGVHFFFLTKMNIQFYIRYFFSYIFLRKKKEKEKEKEWRNAGKRRIKRLFGAKTLRADFPTQNLYLFLYAFSFLQIKRKTIF